MALRGDVLYVGAGDGGLIVVDVADSSHPRVLCSLRSFGYTFGVALAGERLYTAERDRGVRIFGSRLLRL